MSLYRRFHDHGFPSLITSNIAHRAPVFRSSDAATLMMNTLMSASREEGVEVLAWVIMPDHIHAVVVVPRGKRLGRFVQLIKGRFAHDFNLRGGQRGSVWQGRYHERALVSERELFAAIEYVHMNPVKAGIVDRPEEYKWSSTRAMLEVMPAYLSG